MKRISVDFIMRRSSMIKLCKPTAFSVFTFILGCTITIMLLPFEKTCSLENTDREYVMKSTKFHGPDLIILILSAPGNFEKRNTIRESWVKLKDRKSYFDRAHGKIPVKYYFVVGNLELSAALQRKLNREQGTHYDMLMLPVIDSYGNLTLKVLKSFEWISGQFDVGVNFKYVLKCDDDTFVYLNLLMEELVDIEKLFLKSEEVYRNIPASNASYYRINAQISRPNVRFNELELYWGYFNGRARVKTKGKWKESDWILCDRYLPYALGGGYILSKNLVRYLAKNAENLRLYHSEDISVGAWLAPVTNILRVHDTRFDTEWTSRGCQNHHLIVHNSLKHGMKDLFKNIIKMGTLCLYEEEERSAYLYDWNVSPSQCCDERVRK